MQRINVGFQPGTATCATESFCIPPFALHIGLFLA